MKTIKTLALLATLTSSWLATAVAQPAPAPAPETKPPAQTAPGGENKTIEAAPSPAPASLAGTGAATNSDKGLRFNFRNVPLDTVLNYLSDAAGFIIVLETKVTGNIDAWSNQPLSKAEAVSLLNTVLNQKGYAAIENGRTLT